MEYFFVGAGIFIYPLALCSLLAFFVLGERLFALQKKRILPKQVMEAVFEGRCPEGTLADASVAGRIAQFFFKHQPEAEALKAYASLEGVRLERGLFILEIVVAAAPLLGLLGTVTGLVQVFDHYIVAMDEQNPAAFAEGIALALTTTILGLSIALPALVGHSYLLRRIDLLAAQINLEVERLVELSSKRKP